MNFTTAKNMEFHTSHVCVYIYLYIYLDNYLITTNLELNRIDKGKCIVWIEFLLQERRC